MLVGAGGMLYGLALVWLPLAFLLGGAGAIAAGLGLAPSDRKSDAR